ncbi:DUF3471 domain-containing protein [Cesiribacter andamanensis]|uniref:DUF3471 domain-containing protein n=1 Tax=Cesiribacter andamanensis TaxID=649507 RepID=UPI00034D9139|nr:DUF3471 domain-containing protein [Cesiribacter andamanensis]
MPPAPNHPSAYAAFTGSYRHPDGFSVEVKQEGDKLLISEGGDFMELVHVGNQRFEALGLSTPLSFKRDASGQVRWLVSYWIEEDLFEKQAPEASATSAH